MKIVNYTDAEKSFKTILDSVIENKEVIVIARNDSQDAVVMSQCRFNNLMKTARLLKPFSEESIR
ncbi:hypothetical protein JCM30760_26240 [Thiomicrorhabdus hydrogeniphila]